MNTHISILAFEHPMEQRLRRVLLALAAVLVLGYVYFVGASVLNIIARKDADAGSMRLQSAIARAEQEYFALSQEVNPTAAYALGLTPISETNYVYRPGNAASAGTIETNAI